MARGGRRDAKDGYVLAPGATHPQGREKASDDAMKAMVRAMIEINKQPMFAYAIEKTDRIVTTDNQDRPSAELQAEGDAAWPKTRQRAVSARRHRA